MATKVIMPKQGLQMTEGTIISWLVKEGGKAVKDEPLFEIETDKLTITIDAAVSGTLLKIVKDEGETVPIAETIAIIGESGEDISGLLSSAINGRQQNEETAYEAVTEKGAAQQQAVKPKRFIISPRAMMLAQSRGVDPAVINGSGPKGLIVEKDVHKYIENTPRITPLAKKIADIEGIDISAISGTGSNGKITRHDLTRPLPVSAGLTPFTGMRKAIATKMADSLSTTAQATVQVEVDMSECVRVKQHYSGSGRKISYTDLIIKAVSKALIDFPKVNSEWTENGILQKDYVNLGLAVALEEGLLVPVIKNAHNMSIEQIVNESRELVKRAKDGELCPDDCSDGSFTISNMGMYGVDSFVAILNPPETGILAIGRIKKAPAVIEDSMEIRPMMSITLTYDHRVLDGAPAARFTSRVREYLENPYLML